MVTPPPPVTVSEPFVKAGTLGVSADDPRVKRFASGRLGIPASRLTATERLRGAIAGKPFITRERLTATGFGRLSRELEKAERIRLQARKPAKIIPGRLPPTLERALKRGPEKIGASLDIDIKDFNIRSGVFETESKEFTQDVKEFETKFIGAGKEPKLLTESQFAAAEATRDRLISRQEGLASQSKGFKSEATFLEGQIKATERAATIRKIGRERAETVTIPGVGVTRIPGVGAIRTDPALRARIFSPDLPTAITARVGAGLLALDPALEKLGVVGARAISPVVPKELQTLVVEPFFKGVISAPTKLGLIGFGAAIAPGEILPRLPSALEAIRRKPGALAVAVAIPTTAAVVGAAQRPVETAVGGVQFLAETAGIIGLAGIPGRAVAAVSRVPSRTVTPRVRTAELRFFPEQRAISLTDISAGIEGVTARGIKVQRVTPTDFAVGISRKVTPAVKGKVRRGKIELPKPFEIIVRPESAAIRITRTTLEPTRIFQPPIVRAIRRTERRAGRFAERARFEAAALRGEPLRPLRTAKAKARAGIRTAQFEAAALLGEERATFALPTQALQVQKVTPIQISRLTRVQARGRTIIPTLRLTQAQRTERAVAAPTLLATRTAAAQIQKPRALTRPAETLIQLPSFTRARARARAAIVTPITTPALRAAQVTLPVVAPVAPVDTVTTLPRLGLGLPSIRRKKKKKKLKKRRKARPGVGFLGLETRLPLFAVEAIEAAGEEARIPTGPAVLKAFAKEVRRGPVGAGRSVLAASEQIQRLFGSTKKRRGRR